MKKILTLSVGMVILITVLNAGPPSSALKDKTISAAPSQMIPPDKNPTKVKIYLRYVEIDGKNSLSMYDSNGGFAIDTLTTFVRAGITVIWKLERASGIKKINRIYSNVSNPVIFKNDAVKRPFSKGYELDIPETASDGIKEEYFIEFITKNNDNITVSTDPYIRIQP
jgi:hypothetical protein